MLKQLPTVAIVILLMIPVAYYWDLAIPYDRMCRGDNPSDDCIPPFLGNWPFERAGEALVSTIGVLALVFIGIKLFSHRKKAVRLGQKLKTSGKGLMAQAAAGGFGRRRW